MTDAERDQNHVTVTLGVSSDDGVTTLPLQVDPITGRLLADIPTGVGTVTSVSVVTANGFAGSVANPTTTPAITISTTVTGILKGNGTAISAAVANTDYQVPITLTTTGTSGAATFDGTTLNIPQYQAAGSYVTSVSGTANRITSSGGTTPVIDIAATYVGQASITTLGTIGTGTWQGTVITTTYTEAKLKTLTGTANRITIGGTATDPTVDISTSYVGQASITTLGTITTGVWNGTTVSVANGGTGATSFTAYAVLCGGTTSTNPIQSIAGVGTAGQVLTSNGAGALPTFQDATGGIPTQITVANEATDTSCFLGFFTAATGDLGPKTNANLTFNSNTGVLTLGQTASASITGNSGTATALQNARTIGGVSFDGTANITVATATGGFTVSGGDLALGANSITMTGSIGTTGARVTKGWFTDLEVTNAIAGSITGNAATVTVANEATDTTCFLGFYTAASGALGGSTNANMTFNSNTGVATFASTVLTTTDINGGTIDGTTIGASSATTATFTTATINTALNPDADGGAALGSATLGFSILGLSSGSTINFANSNVVLTHSSGILTVTTGDLRVTTAGTNSASVVTVGGTQTLSAKTLTAPKFVDGGFIADANGNEEIIFTTTASAVNEITIANAATGTTGPLIKASGETNVDIRLSGKGTGKVHNITAEYGDINAAADGGTVTFDLSLANSQTVTLGGNRTLALSNAAVGQYFMIRLLQDGTGTRTVTWFTTIKWAGGAAPTLTTTANKADSFGFFCTSSGNYDGFVIGQNI